MREIEAPMNTSEQERRERQKAYSQAYRDRKRRERDEALAAISQSSRPASTVMSDAVAESIAAMKWLVPSDGASVMMARMLAKDVDALADATDPSLVSIRLRSSMALLKVLQELGGTPRVRIQHELRSQRLQRRSEAAQQPSAALRATNVSKFERPKTRR